MMGDTFMATRGSAIRSPFNGRLWAGRIVLYFALILALHAPGPARADSFAAKSGAQLSGKVIELKQGAVAILGNDGTITTVNWSDIRTLKINDHVLVTLDTGETLAGLLTVQGGFVYLTSPSLGTVSIAQNKIVSITRKKTEVLPFAVAAAAAQPQEMGSIRGRGDQGTPPAEEKKAGAKKAKKEESAQQPETATETGQPSATIGQKEEKRPEQTFVRSDQVVLPQGKLETELGVTYYDNSHLGLGLQGARDRLLVFPFTARYAFTDRFLGVVTVPGAVAWRDIPTFSGTTSNEAFGGTKAHEASGLGDVSFGMQYQIFTERAVRPALMVYLLGASDTGKGGFLLPYTQTPLGSGFWQINPGVSFVKTVDPVVLFGSLSYTHFFDKSGFQPGEAVNPILGVGFAVNDEIAISFKLAGSIITRPQFHGQEFGETLSPFSFYFTLDKYITNNSYLEPSVGIGLTSDAPDFIFGLTYVYRWF
jgi:hypothetical protein